MKVFNERCCGIDVHTKSVVCCLLSPDIPEGKEIKTFGTMTDDLLDLADWLTKAECSHVAMESTGVYWKPVFNILEGLMEVILVNAQHIKKVPGRKTDVSDCEWIAELLQYGLLKGSFIPPKEIRELRELTRYRKTLIRQKADQINRIHKLLETTNIKIGQVVTDLMGVSGRAILKAIAKGEGEGESDPERLADLAEGRLRNKLPELRRALKAKISKSQRFLLAEELFLIEQIEASIERCNEEIRKQMSPSPFLQSTQILDEIPGVDNKTAEVIISEIGVDMSRFPSDKHISSWAGMCPGNNESAGKRKSGKTSHGNPWLRAALIEAAWAASHCNNSYLQAQYQRLVRRRGKKKALVAVGHSILVIAYHLLAKQIRYQDLGHDYFLKLNLNKESEQKRLIRKLEALGLKVTVEPLQMAA